MAKAKAAQQVTDHRRFREDFEAIACGKADCTHADELIVLRSNCHPDAPVTVKYSFALQAVAVACAVCGMGIIDVAVAARNGNHHNKKAGALPARTPAPTTVQRMDAAARKNRARRK